MSRLPFQNFHVQELDKENIFRNSLRKIYFEWIKRKKAKFKGVSAQGKKISMETFTLNIENVIKL